MHIGSHTLLRDLTNFDIENFQLSLKGQYKEKTQENYANTLKSFVRFWYSFRKTDASWERIRGPRVPEKLANFITLEKFQKIDMLFNENEYHKLTKKLIFHLLWNTGMRIGELLAINISDIDSAKQHTYITTEKSKKLRVAMWNEECHQLLLKYLGIRICLNQAPELFQSSVRKNRHTRLTARSVQRWCKDLGNALGFPINPHAFRHGKCHYIITNGGGRHHVQAIAGHSSIQSSETYVRLNIHEQTKVQEQFLPQSFTKSVRKYYSVIKNNEWGLSTG